MSIMVIEEEDFVVLYLKPKQFWSKYKYIEREKYTTYNDEKEKEGIVSNIPNSSNTRE